MKQRNNESAVVMGVLQNPPDEKPNPGKEAAKEAKPSRAAEVRRTIEEYANNLREIIKKLGGASIEAIRLECGVGFRQLRTGRRC